VVSITFFIISSLNLPPYKPIAVYSDYLRNYKIPTKLGVVTFYQCTLHQCSIQGLIWLEDKDKDLRLKDLRLKIQGQGLVN